MRERHAHVRRPAQVQAGEQGPRPAAAATSGAGFKSTNIISSVSRQRRHSDERHQRPGRGIQTNAANERPLPQRAHECRTDPRRLGAAERQPVGWRAGATPAVRRRRLSVRPRVHTAASTPGAMGNRRGREHRRWLSVSSRMSARTNLAARTPQEHRSRRRATGGGATANDPHGGDEDSAVDRCAQRGCHHGRYRSFHWIGAPIEPSAATTIASSCGRPFDVGEPARFG